MNARAEPHRIELRLEAWGIWSRRSTVNLGVKSVMGDLIGHTGNRRTIDISDDEALGIDRVVCMLTKHNGEMGRIVVLAYVRGLPQRRIAEIMRVSKTRVHTLLLTAVNWIDGALIAGGEL